MYNMVLKKIEKRRLYQVESQLHGQFYKDTTPYQALQSRVMWVVVYPESRQKVNPLYYKYILKLQCFIHHIVKGHNQPDLVGKKRLSSDIRNKGKQFLDNYLLQLMVYYIRKGGSGEMV